MNALVYVCIWPRVKYALPVRPPGRHERPQKALRHVGVPWMGRTKWSRRCSCGACAAMPQTVIPQDYTHEERYALSVCRVPSTPHPPRNTIPTTLQSVNFLQGLPCLIAGGNAQSLTCIPFVGEKGNINRVPQILITAVGLNRAAQQRRRSIFY